jgi:hypothetical protein
LFESGFKGRALVEKSSKSLFALQELWFWICGENKTKISLGEEMCDLVFSKILCQS